MKIYNFSAGPACFPDTVLDATKKAAIDYKGTGMSVMEMSHRSEPIVGLFHETTSRVRDILDVPSNYKVLWLQGGASLQFAMAPMNLLSNGATADYIETGLWSTKAITECNNVATANVIATSKYDSFNFIPKVYKQNMESKYLHITSNNTIYGTQYKVFPKVKNRDGYLVADMSSDILSRPINVSDFGLIYAGAQKNMGPAGVTLVIVREDLIGNGLEHLPTMMRYETHVKKKSMFNTPPVLSVFVVNETLKWLEEMGGLSKMEEINKRKSKKLYQEIDRNSCFKSIVDSRDRSMMNIPFVFVDSSKNDNDFLRFCAKRGLKTLKGHRSIGGFRASIYNAMPEKGVDALILTMQEFETEEIH